MSFTALRDLLTERDVLILDGAMGTALETRGEHLHPTLWSAGHLVSNPSAIREIHSEYLQAGADIITTASYQVSYEGFATMGYDRQQTAELIQLATQLAQQATSGFQNRLVASSVGCYGAHLADGSEFRGYSLTAAELYAWHMDKLSAHSGADIVACETVPCVAEVQALTNALTDLEVDVQAWISMSCQSAHLLSSGEHIEEACRAIEDPVHSHANHSCLAVGVNCTSPQYVEEILHTFKECCRKDRILVAYPNRGEPWDATRRCFDEGAGCADEQFVKLAVKWKEAGARVIGGCCRTNPKLIAELRRTICGGLIDG